MARLLKSVARHPHIVDFSCGTGRNTVKPLGIPGANIVGLDASEKMIERAQLRFGKFLSNLPENSKAASLDLMVYDPLEHLELPSAARNVDAIISTLVIEHMQLQEGVPENPHFVGAMKGY